MQRQQFAAQLSEVTSALEELKGKDECYRIIGNIMVASKKEDIKKDLTDKKEMFELRIKTVEKQEKSIKEKAEGMRAEVMKMMSGKDGDKS
jgi:prefoldin beta subunit